MGGGGGGGGAMGGMGGEDGGAGDGGGAGGDGGVNAQMHCLYEEHEPELPLLWTARERWTKTQPGGQYVELGVYSYAVLSDRPSAVAAASHSLLVEMRAPPQEPLSIM